MKRLEKARKDLEKAIERRDQARQRLKAEEYSVKECEAALTESENYWQEYQKGKDIEQIGELVGGSFYVLPSSIHEVLILPESSEMNLRDLSAMVREINATEVTPEDLDFKHGTGVHSCAVGSDV